MQKFLFLDCESAGLRGEVFAAGLLDNDGNVLFDGFYRHESLVSNEWLNKNVEPNLSGVEYPSMEQFQTAFVKAYNGARATHGIGEYNALQVVAHMGSPVESNFFQQLFANDMIREVDGPYPLLDTAPLLLAASHDPTSEEAYLKAAYPNCGVLKNHITHNAISDARITREVWNYLH